MGHMQLKIAQIFLNLSLIKKKNLINQLLKPEK